MAKKNKTTDGIKILHDRYVQGKIEREASLEQERVNVLVARMIHDIRTDAGLTQQQLAELVGTTQSVISRLEDADYEGHSLSMLQRIAGALKQKLTVEMEADDPGTNPMRYAFHLTLQMLRKSRGMSIDELAFATDVDREDLLALERKPGTRPTPYIMHQLSNYFEIPERPLLQLAGAVREIPEELSTHASRFAAQSESFRGLTDDERRVIDDFVRCLKAST